jgi:hypothetical protein
MLLGIMAAVSLLEALAVIGLFVGAFLIYRHFLRAIHGIEERQVAPAAARVNAILNDIKAVTSTVKEGSGRVEWAVVWVIDAIRRLRKAGDMRY